MDDGLSKKVTNSFGKEKEDMKTDRRRKVKPLPGKKFEIRESLITTLCENPHIKVIKHIFIASLIALFLNTVVHDILEHGECKLGFKVITLGMAKFHWVVFMWIIINLCTILAYTCFNVWANVRINFPPKAQNVVIWDTVFLMGLIAYYILQFRVISVVVSYLQLPIGSSSIVCLEQTRCLMKLHAFVRTNAEKVLNFKPHSDKKLKLCSLQHFAYFMFAPTLVYCDEYPRRQNIRWKFVFEKILELVGTIFYYAFLLERFIIPNYKDIGLRPYSISELTIMIFDNIAVGIMFLLLAFYAVLDTTQNLFGELLKFGDRKFYLDWWTATSYSQYFRTWNIVVGDWLYMYVYKDCYEHVVPGNKIVAKIVVFLISGIVHEWVLTYTFGFLFPALFLAFSCTGAFLSFLSIPKHDIANVVFWFFLAFGSGLLSSLYAMEYFVRANIPTESDTYADFFVPRLFTCKCIVY